MQSHASRHVCSEFLKDLHPDLSPPFPKVRSTNSLRLGFAAARPLSDASSLLDDTPQEPIKDEIAVAYGRRGIIKVRRVTGPTSAWHATHEHMHGSTARSHPLMKGPVTDSCHACPIYQCLPLHPVTLAL